MHECTQTHKHIRGDRGVFASMHARPIVGEWLRVS
jgi:hypothetical protein